MLKEYQERVIREVHGYLQTLAEVRTAGETSYGALAAWKKCGIRGRYTPEENGIGEDLPRFCLKVPTGGGKTLLATQILGSVFQTILADRNGAGLVLWVVPSTQIYRDTLKKLRDREDLHRIGLEHAVSRRIEVWEKSEITRLSPARLRDCLNIFLLMLPAVNRETKEQLKIFRDSGGNIVQHFPPEDELDAHRQLKVRVPNLETIKDGGRDTDQIKTSVGNLVRLCRPAVVLDEGHKATSELAQSTIRGFNASVILELSATPHHGANILSRVSGQELLREDMIKLPLNIATSGVRSWTDVLTRARDKRESLWAAAKKYAADAGLERLIRPVVLVQVERVGKEQRGVKVGGHRVIHSEDVKEYLIQRLGQPADSVKIKTSEKDELIERDLDLMDPECPVTWIITKAALQEGWDCPFAYILVSLDNTGSGRAMTQLIGRVLRQPYQEKTSDSVLNQSYVYCLRTNAGELARQVKSALEEEGYEGDLESAVVDQSEGDNKATTLRTPIRDEFLSMYRKPFEGKIYLPHFCVRSGKEYKPLDYFRHLVSQVDVAAFEYEKAAAWKVDDAIAQAKDRFYSVTLGSELAKEYETAVDLHETDEQVTAWTVASLPFDFLSFKQLRVIVQRAYERLGSAELLLKGNFGRAKFAIRDHIERFVNQQVDKQTQTAFARLYDEDRLCFFLQCARCRFALPDFINVQVTHGLQHTDAGKVKNSLFEYVDESQFNEYERAVALCLDRDVNVLWWYRNLVGEGNFSIQGYRRQKIWPDFIVQDNAGHRPHHRVIVIETKGEQLQGNLDTLYKRDIAAYFQKVGKQVTWQQLSDDFKDHMFRFQILDETQEGGRDWRDELRDILSAQPA